MTTLTNTKPDILNYLASWLLKLDRNAEIDSIDPDEDIVESGLIDSLEFVNFLFIIEEKRGAEIPASRLKLEKFKTLNSIVANYF